MMCFELDVEGELTYFTARTHLIAHAHKDELLSDIRDAGVEWSLCRFIPATVTDTGDTEACVRAHMASGRTNPHATDTVPIAAAVREVLSEVLADMKAYIVPASVSCFSELHQYRDANEYGGFCDSLRRGDWSIEAIDEVQRRVGVVICYLGGLAGEELT